MVMTGGSSLAVWMGGVTNEVNRLRRGEGAYGDALRLIGATVRVDVISGTSAGGLNGAVMAMAVSREDSSLDSLRSLWAGAGSFAQLLRDPFEADPPSLFRGDAYFLESLRDALGQLAGDRVPTPPHENPVDLMMTGSLLSGRDSATPDDFGSLVVDSDHHALFRFRRGGGSGHVAGCAHDAEGTDDDDFTGPTAVARLALAARCSASFPIAFEPSFVPIGDDDATDERPNMRCNANFRASRYVVDGGVLMNKPLEPALRSIFELPAQRQVRRVLAYVVPDPGARFKETADPAEPVPAVMKVALDSLVTLPRHESVAAELDDLRRHNERARLQRDARSGIVVALQQSETAAPVTPGADDEFEEAARRLYDAYLQARVKLSVDRILDHVADGVHDLSGTASGTPLWNLEPLRTALETQRLVFLPASFPSADEFLEGTWRWGLQSIEHVGEVVMDLLRRPLRMTNPRSADQDVTAQRGELMRLREIAYRILEGVRRLGDSDSRRYWRGTAEAALAALRDSDDATAAWAEQAFAGWVDAAGTGEGDVLSALREAALWLAGALVQAVPAITLLTDESRVLRSERHEATTLRTVMQTLVAPTPEATLRRLMALHVVETVLAPGARELDQVVELIQISGNTANGFDGRSKAEEKIAGVKLGHFGAFYKTSWRANDWMWGRLDGAARLAQVLLAPARLRQLQLSPIEVVELLEPIVLGPAGSPEREVLDDGSARGWRRADALAELAFLEPGSGTEDPPPLPRALPVCTRSLARRLQLDVIREELPNVADAIHLDKADGAHESARAVAFASEVKEMAPPGTSLAPESARRMFARCRVGDEQVADEVGSDLFAVTAAKTAAVATSVGQGSRLGFDAVNGAFRFVRGIVLAFYLLTKNAASGSGIGLVLMTLALALGAILVAAATLDDGADAVLAVGVALVGGGFAFAALRAGALRALGGILFTAVMIASPEIFSAIGKWLASSKAPGAAAFEAVGKFATEHRAAVIMTALFAVPFVLALVGRPRRIERFAARRPVAGAVAAAAIIGLVGVVVVFGGRRETAAPRIVEFELAGSAAAVHEIRADWTPVELDAVARATGWDFALIAGYVAVISAGAALATGLWSRRDPVWNRRGRLAGTAVVLAGLLDVAENLVILRLLGTETGSDVLPRTMWFLAATKFAILGLALVYTASGVVASFLPGAAADPEDAGT